MDFTDWLRWGVGCGGVQELCVDSTDWLRWGWGVGVCRNFVWTPLIG